MKSLRGPMKIIQSQGPRGRLTIRLPDDLHEKISKFARANRVSINHVIVETLDRDFSKKK